MALITDQPRSASVVVVGEADIIEVSREALQRVTRQIPALKDVLDRFLGESEKPLRFVTPMKKTLLQRILGGR